MPNKFPRVGLSIVLIGMVLLLYAASLGPACRLCDERRLDGRAVWIFYRPIIWFYYRGPTATSRGIEWWINLFRKVDRPDLDLPAPFHLEWDVQNPDVFGL